MLPPHDDFGPGAGDPDEGADRGSAPDALVHAPDAADADTLETALNRHLSRRTRLFLGGVSLLALGMLSLLLWQGFVPPAHREAIAGTPIPSTPAPTLPPAGSISATIPIGAVHAHTSIAASADAVWVHDGPSGMVTRIDPTTDTVVAMIAVDGDAGGTIAIGEQAVWVTDDATGIVSRIDPQRNRVTATIRLGPGTGLLGVSPGAVWVINVPNNTVTKIDEQTDRVLATLATPPMPIGVSYGAGSVWLCSRNGGAAGVTRLDPQTNRIQARIDVGSARGLWCNGALVAQGRAVWVPIFDTVGHRQHLLERIDLATNTVTDTIELGGDMNPETAGDERGVWVCDPTTGLLRVDPQTRRVVAAIKLPGGDSMALGAGSLWLTRTSDNSVVRITLAP